jgi:hypothetical protein
MIIFLLQTHKLVILLLSHFYGKDQLGQIFEGITNVKGIILQATSHLCFFSFKLRYT